MSASGTGARTSRCEPGLELYLNGVLGDAQQLAKGALGLVLGGRQGCRVCRTAGYCLRATDFLLA